MKTPDLARLDELRHTVEEVLAQLTERSNQGLYEGGTNAAVREIRAVMNDQLERLEKVLEVKRGG